MPGKPRAFSGKMPRRDKSRSNKSSIDFTSHIITTKATGITMLRSRRFFSFPGASLWCRKSLKSSGLFEKKLFKSKYNAVLKQCRAQVF